MIKAYAAFEPGNEVRPYEYDPGPLGRDEIEIDVRYCGLCHSDVSMLQNDWAMSAYPLVAGHEVVGTVSAAGEGVQHLQPGDRVGLGWFSRSCGVCRQCLAGDDNLCAASEGTIVGRHGGFAERVRTHSRWAARLPEGIDLRSAGPLFCGGITVFNPIVQNGILPTDRVAVVGIGGLGHMALKFLRAWGCEVTALSTSSRKRDEALALGAHHFVDTTEPNALAALANSFAMVLVTVNVALDWDALIAALAPRGVLHLVGAAPEVKSQVFPLIGAQRSISASPLGSPATVASMLDFAARHGIAPNVEEYPMSRLNDAIRSLLEDRPAHRLVLRGDW